MSSPYSFGLAFPVAVKVAVNPRSQVCIVHVMPGQKRVHEERKTKKPEGTKERTLQASPRHVNFISLLRNNFFLFVYQLVASPRIPTLPLIPKDYPRIPSFHHKSNYSMLN